VIGLSRSDAHPELQDALGWIGSRVDDVYGTTLGEVSCVWTDPQTGRPRWLVVRWGRFGGQYTLVPFSDASGGTSDVWIPYDSATVRSAPKVTPSHVLTAELDARVAAHYLAAREAATPAPPPLPARPRAEHAHRLG
jgi:hypothetical protein